MKANTGQVCLIENVLCHVQNTIQIPCNEIHISTVDTNCIPDTCNCIWTTCSTQLSLNLILELTDLLAAVFTGEAAHWIEKEACHSPICMEVVDCMVLIV